jgi:hypothetical protein
MEAIMEHEEFPLSSKSEIRPGGISLGTVRETPLSCKKGFPVHVFR